MICAISTCGQAAGGRQLSSGIRAARGIGAQFRNSGASRLGAVRQSVVSKALPIRSPGSIE